MVRFETIFLPAYCPQIFLFVFVFVFQLDQERMCFLSGIFLANDWVLKPEYDA